MKNYATNEEILEVIAMCGGCVPDECAGHDCTCRIQAKAIEEVFRVGRRSTKPQGPFHLVYTEAELERLGAMVGDGASTPSIAAELGRSRKAIYTKIQRLVAKGKIKIPIKQEVKELTKRQKEALDVIKAFWSEHGYAPSYEIIAQKLNAKSKSTVFRLVKSLEAGGYITKRSHSARSVRLMDHVG